MNQVTYPLSTSNVRIPETFNFMNCCGLLYRFCFIYFLLTLAIVIHAAPINENASAADTNSAEAIKKSNSPFAFSLSYKSDVIRGLKGSLKNDYFYLGNIDAKLNIDGEKLLNLKNSSFFLYVLNNHGSKPNHLANTIQGVDNIEVDINTTKLYQAWFQLNKMDNRLSFLVGLYDLNSEFYVTDSSSIFINPAFGIGSEFGATGINGPSIFPVTSMALRLKYQTEGAFYIQSALFDGVPGNPANPYGTHIRFAKGGGTLLVYEAGILPSFISPVSELKLAVGGWRYSAKYPDQLDMDSDGNPISRRNSGYYFLAEDTIWQSDINKNRQLKVFFRAGRAPGSINAISFAFQSGFTIKGLSNNRPDDILGIGLARAHYGRQLRTLAELANTYVNHETAYEVSYKSVLNEHIFIQPFIQKTIGNQYPSLENKTVFCGVRFELNY